MLVEEILSSLKALEMDTPDISEHTMKRAMELFLKDCQWFPDDIRKKMEIIFPPKPKPQREEEEPDEFDNLTGNRSISSLPSAQSDDPGF